MRGVQGRYKERLDREEKATEAGKGPQYINYAEHEFSFLGSGGSCLC